MDRVEEIEAAIEGLPPEEFRPVARWVGERLQRDWDLELDADFASGKLDFLFEEARISADWLGEDLEAWCRPDRSLAGVRDRNAGRR